MENNAPIWLTEEIRPLINDLISTIVVELSNINESYRSNDDMFYLQHIVTKSLDVFQQNNLADYPDDELTDFNDYFDEFENLIDKYEESGKNEYFSRVEANNEFKFAALELFDEMIIKLDLDVRRVDIDHLRNLAAINVDKYNISCHGIRKSHEKGWKRNLAKYDPILAYYLSPIKPTVANYRSIYANDAYDDSLLWLLVMSEKLFYDNSCLLCSGNMTNPSRLKKLLRRNTNLIDYSYLHNNWTDIVKLGMGSFGVVAKFRDNMDQEVYAVKYIKFDKTQVRVDSIDFVNERNYLIRASKSPLVVRIMYTFQIPNLPGMFLVMEYCVADLDKFLKKLHELTNMSPLKTISDNDSTSFPRTYDYIQHDLLLDIKKIVIVYIFELFAILDYLAACNIVHSDIKPANIMISELFHLKVGDLGLVNNTFYVTDPNRNELFEVSDIIDQQNEKYILSSKGTPMYKDPETAYMKLADNDYLIAKINESAELDNINSESTDINFLYDTFAMGLIASDILFLGSNIFDYVHYSVEERKLFNRHHRNLFYHIISMCLSQNDHRIIEPGFEIAFDGYLGQLPAFVASTLNVRSKRCPDYMTTKKVLIYKHQDIYKCIDIGKVEQIDVFRMNNINAANVFLHNMPADIQLYLPDQNQLVKYDSFDQYMETINSMTNTDDGVQYLQPGFNLGYQY